MARSVLTRSPKFKCASFKSILLSNYVFFAGGAKIAFCIISFINPLIFYIMEFLQVQAAKAVYIRSNSKWVLQESSILNFTDKEFSLFVSTDTANWFRRLGSKQVLSKSYTSYGYQVTKLVSYSPDMEEKHEYNFRFIS
jgi:hypothetical protein